MRKNDKNIEKKVRGEVVKYLFFGLGSLGGRNAHLSIEGALTHIPPN